MKSLSGSGYAFKHQQHPAYLGPLCSLLHTAEADGSSFMLLQTRSLCLALTFCLDVHGPGFPNPAEQGHLQ